MLFSLEITELFLTFFLIIELPQMENFAAESSFLPYSTPSLKSVLAC